ncbi:MAG: PP2C family protein-serine/threonine phosphatase [Acidobacteriota bacterium]
MELAFAAATDTGLVRRRNEDSFVAERDLGLFVVVDGMGGHAAGELASRTVADGVHEFIRSTERDPEKTWPFGIDPELSQPANRLQVAIRCANRKLADLVNTDQTLDGTGATISAALFADDRLVVSNVGDCRAYLIRANVAYQITRDHSYVAEQIALGLLDTEEARLHPMRHMVTRAVSGDAGISVDTWEIRVVPGDRLLLCSDGVHSLLSDDELSAIVTTDAALEEICQQLVDGAMRAGGTDNSTVILVAVNP